VAIKVVGLRREHRARLLACLAHVNFLLHMYFDLITEQINDDDDDDDD